MKPMEEMQQLGVESPDVIEKRAFDYIVIAIENLENVRQVRSYLLKKSFSTYVRTDTFTLFILYYSFLLPVSVSFANPELTYIRCLNDALSP